MQENIEFDAESGRLNGVPLLGGLLAGVGAFVAGYLSFLGIAAGTGDGIDPEVESLQQVGLLFYNSFQVPTRMQGTTPIETEAGDEGEIVRDLLYNPFFGSDGVEERQRVLLEGEVVQTDPDPDTPVEVVDVGLSLPTFVYVALPAFVLFAVGVALAVRFVEPTGDSTPGRVLVGSVAGGMTMTVGFLLVAMPGLFAFTLGDQLLYVDLLVEPQFSRPDREAALLFGTLYPAVAGTAGVFVGQLLSRRRDTGTAGPETEAVDSGEHDRTPAEEAAARNPDTDPTDERE